MTLQFCTAVLIFFFLIQELYDCGKLRLEKLMVFGRDRQTEAKVDLLYIEKVHLCFSENVLYESNFDVLNNDTACGCAQLTYAWRDKAVTGVN